MRVARLPVVVGGLRQRPDVVFGDQAVRTRIRATAVAAGGTRIAFAVIIPVLRIVDLVVERFGAVVPHLQQPVDAKRGFVRKVRRRRRARSTVSRI